MPTTFCSAINLFGPVHSQKAPQHIHHENICFLPSHVFNKYIFEKLWKIHYACLNMFWQEETQTFHKTSPTSEWKMASSKNKGKAHI